MNSKLINNSFNNFLSAQFLVENSSQLSQTEVKDFLDYLIKSNVIPKTTIKILSVLVEFEKLRKEFPGMKKRKYVSIIAKELNLNENSIFNILKDHKDRFSLT